MKNKPMFSICIPVYNKKKYLRKCLESIAYQTNDDYEILFVDDCSTDGSKELLDGLAECMDRVRVIKNVQNQGLSNNRNILIENAIGKYILFLDQDDTINEQLLEKLKPYADDNIDIIRYQINLINEKPEKDLERFNFQTNGQVMSGEKAIKFFSGNCDKRYALACSFCMRRQFLNENGIRYPQDFRLYEDVATLPIIIARAKTVQIIDYKGYNYFRNDDSLTRNIDSEKNLFEYVDKSFRNQKQFIKAADIAKDGVLNSSISDEAKKVLIEDMLLRINLYNNNLIEKIKESRNRAYGE